MKQDYLWDKTGTDAEIESLENALAVFRYRETAAPPALPAKVIPFKKESPRRFKRFAYAIAACLALMIISLGVWFQVSNKKIEIGTDLANTPSTVEKFPNQLSVNDPQSPPVIKADAPKQSFKRRIVKAKKAAAARPTQTIARNLKIEKPATLKLTKEEKYAYDELMRALSITSSKLKLVKDKVEGSEE